MCRLPLVQGKRGTHASLTIFLQGNRGGQTQTEAFAGKDSPLLRQVRRMRVSRIVEGRTADQLKGKRATHHLHETPEVTLVPHAPPLPHSPQTDHLTPAPS